MTTLERLSHWQRDSLLTESEHAAIAAIVRKDRFSVFLELNALLYLGVLAIAAGLAWTIQTSFKDFGDVAIVLTLSAALGGCFYYCFSRGLPYSPTAVESPRLAFDYVLYLGCLIFAIELAYFEIRFQLLRTAWDYHVLLSAMVFLALAYRFDNRFVLSLALSTVAAWFGIKLSSMGWDSPSSLRPSALAYGGVVVGVGVALHRLAIKRHFLETYLHVAANAIFLALLNGTVEHVSGGVYLIGLLAVSAIAIGAGSRYRRFAFVGYGVIYTYLGITARLLEFSSNTMLFGYLLVSGTAVMILLVYIARTLGREE